MTSKPSRVLDKKLAKIMAGKYRPSDFIIADAKDADMAFGVMAPSTFVGKRWGDTGPGIYKSRQNYIQDMQALIKQGQIDIMLASASNAEILAKNRTIGIRATLAVRGNDSTDIWNPRGSDYPKYPSRNFRSVNLKETRKFCDLYLYSMTFNNDVEEDRRTLAAYREFRIEAAELGVRHFLEVFNPNTPRNLRASDLPGFINDRIVSTLAGVTQRERPIFLKIAYNGGAAIAELAQSDSTLIVGILGGSSGTTRDTFELLRRGEESGARVALFGRKIQRAESQLDIVGLMRPVIEGQLSPEEAVHEYHSRLMKKKISPQRPIKEDLKITDPSMLAE